MRRWNLLSTLLSVSLLLAGCDWLEVQAPVDGCSPTDRPREEDFQACQQKPQTTPVELPVVPRSGEAGRGLPISPELLGFGDRPVTHVLALDYSGSMYGGYERPTPAPAILGCGWTLVGGQRQRVAPFYWQEPGLRRLLNEGPLAGLRPTDPAYALAFNGEATLLGGAAPLRLDGEATLPSSFRPWLQEGARSILDALTATEGGSLPADPFQAPFGDARSTRISAALAAAARLFASHAGGDGILWLITDNIVEETSAAPGSSEFEDARDNQSFYRELRENPSWQVAFAWPLRKGDWFCGSTLMVYGLYYSSQPAIEKVAYEALTDDERGQLDTRAQQEAFAALTQEGAPFPGKPFKLKPLHLDTIRVAFQGGIECSRVDVGEASLCRAKLEIRNLLHHRTISSARLLLTNGRCDPWRRTRAGRWLPVPVAAPFCSDSIRLADLTVEPLKPTEMREQEVEFRTPPVRTELSSFAHYLASAQAPKLRLLGRMEVEIQDLTTETTLPREALAGVYGVKDLPTLFQNQRVHDARTAICLDIPVNNPDYHLAVAVLLLIALLAVGVLGLGALARPTYWHLVVDGQPMAGQLRLMRLASSALRIGREEVGRARLSLSGLPRVRAQKGYRLSPERGGWRCAKSGGAMGEERHLRLERVGKLASRPGAARRQDPFA
jgi:hypothetical protein